MDTKWSSNHEKSFTYYFISLIAIFIVFAYQAQAEEEWTIDSFKDLTYARVSGEVTHGDSLNFFISRNDDCLKVYNKFCLLHI